MGPLLEGIRDLSQACSLSLIVPGLAVVLSARNRRGWVVGGVLGATWFFAWMKAAGWLPGTPDGVWSVVGGAAFVGAGLVSWRGASSVSGVGSGAVAGALATWLWAPCVGPQLAHILNGAPEAPFRQLVPMGMFVLGLSVPILFVALAPVAIPRLRRVLAPVATAGMFLVLVLGGAMAIGWYDDVVIQLNRWSTPAS